MFLLLLFNVLISDLPAQHTPCDSIVHLRNIALDSARFQDYYVHQLALEDYYVEGMDYPALEATSEDYILRPSTAVDSSFFRRHLMYHGYMLRRQIGSVSQAIRFYERAHDFLPDKRKLDGLAWFTEKELANLYAQLNDFDRAIYFSNLVASRLLYDGQEGKLGRLYSDLGDLYKWIGDSDTALKYYNSGLELGRSTANQKAINANQQSLARFYLDRKDTLAFMKVHGNLLQSLQAVERNDTYHYRLAEAQLLYADYLRVIDDLTGEENALLKVIPTYQKHYKGDVVREIAKIYHRLSRNALERNELDKAESYYESGIKWIVPGEESHDSRIITSSMENTFYDLSKVRADLHWRRYQNAGLMVYLDSALVHIDLALQVNALMHQALTNVGSKLVSLEYDHSLISQKVDLLYEAYEGDKSEGVLERISECFLISKYRLFLDSESSRNWEDNFSKEVMDSIISQRNQLIRLYGQRSLGIEPNSDVDTEIYQLERNLDRLQNSGEIREPLEEIEVEYVEYFWGEKYLYRLSNFEGAVVVDQLVDVVAFEADLDLLLDELHQPKTKISSFLVSRISKILFEGLPEVDSHFVVIPDGKLCLLPFDILTLGDAQLFDRGYSIRHTRFERNVESSDLDDVMIFAPEYDDSALLSLRRNALGPLYYASDEIKAIKQSGTGTVVVRSEMNPLGIQDYGTHYDVFHFVGHASSTSDKQGIWVNSLDDELSMITRDEISRMDLNYGLVTLSACDTGYGKYAKGDGVQSLASAFLNAGVGSVLYSLWAVNDRATSKLMSLFYTSLESGLAPSYALSNAKREFLAQASPEQRHPYYWAGFTLTTIEKEQYRRSVKSYLFSIMVFFMVLLLFYYFKTPKK